MLTIVFTESLVVSLFPAQNLRDTLDSMYDARVPKLWQKISWDSSTIGFWYTELLDRDTQFRSWVFGGRPNVFWMTGFFNPNGFLTAMRQVCIVWCGVVWCGVVWCGVVWCGVV